VSTRATRAGRLVHRGEADALEALLPELEQAAREGAKASGFRILGGERVFLKHGPLRGKHALRHALRRAVGLVELPRLQEFANLSWLRERGFGAPRPILAGAFLRRGIPCHQFLCTAGVAGAEPMASVLRGRDPELRARVLCALARDLARLHAAGFVHRDLFARNLLVEHPGPAGRPRIVFLDAWRSSPGRGLRGPAHDLGCFFLEAGTWLESREQALFLDTYRREYQRMEHAEPAERFVRRVARARRRALARERARHPQAFAEHWDPPELR
jgi:tRNA A-37 threonylcarbamoyl transferase component Bud32